MSTTASTATAAGASDRAGASRRQGTFYRGDPGMWSWVLHRITGVLTFFFLFVHVLDTALVRVSPNTYDQVIETYKTPIVNLLEVGLVGAVLFHALNGIRVMLVDFWEKGVRLQRQMLYVEIVVFAVLMGPASYFMLRPVAERYLGS